MGSRCAYADGPRRRPPHRRGERRHHPDRGQFGVFLIGSTKGARVGELDEEMVFESRTGDTVILGATTWRIEEINHDRVLVSPAPGEPGKMPFWHGDRAGRPAEFGQQIAK